jgi:hypothetical protein
MSCHLVRSGKGTVFSVPPPVILIIFCYFENKASQEFTQKSPQKSQTTPKIRIQNKKKLEFTMREANIRNQMTSAKIF